MYLTYVFTALLIMCFIEVCVYLSNHVDFADTTVRERMLLHSVCSIVSITDNIALGWIALMVDIALIIGITKLHHKLIQKEIKK